MTKKVEALEEICFWKCLYPDCKTLISGPSGISVEADYVCDGKNKQCSNYYGRVQKINSQPVYRKSLRASA